MSARHFLLLLVFTGTCFFSAATLLPGLSFYRYPYFERYLDVFYVMLLLLGSVKSRRTSGSIYATMLMFSILIASAISAWAHFGSLYVFVEYRQFLLIGLSIAYLVCAGKRLSAESIVATFPIYLTFLVINFVFGTVFHEYYRPGVFGESNYDLAYVSVVLVAKLSKKGPTFDYLPALLFFAVVSQSRTAMAVVVTLSVLRASSFKGVLFLMIALPVAFLLLKARLWGDSAGSGDLIEQLDRIQMLMAYVDAVNNNGWLAVFGQAFSGITFKADVLGFYLETQAASAALGFNTPSNFHGHMLRGFLLLGIPLYFSFIVYVLRKARKVHGRKAFVIICSVVAVTGITQSIFAHPFAGTLFAVVSIMGFSESNRRLTLLPVSALTQEIDHAHPVY